VFEVYFIKTATRDLMAYLNNTDTISAVFLGVPGDDAGNVDDFKRHLAGSMRFDTSSVVISQKNHLELEYEGSAVLLSGFGCIEYHKGSRYKLTRSYKRFYINNKNFVIELEDFLPINSFTAITTKAN
jgi:hypothetical protein